MEINYGKQRMKLDIPEDRLVWSFSPHRLNSEKPAAEIITTALTDPVGTGRLFNMAAEKNDVMIVDRMVL